MGGGGGGGLRLWVEGSCIKFNHCMQHPPCLSVQDFQQHSHRGNSSFNPLSIRCGEPHKRLRLPIPSDQLHPQHQHGKCRRGRHTPQSAAAAHRVCASVHRHRDHIAHVRHQVAELRRVGHSLVPNHSGGRVHLDLPLHRARLHSHTNMDGFKGDVRLPRSGVGIGVCNVLWHPDCRVRGSDSGGR